MCSWIVHFFTSFAKLIQMSITFFARCELCSVPTCVCSRHRCTNLQSLKFTRVPAITIAYRITLPLDRQTLEQAQRFCHTRRSGNRHQQSTFTKSRTGSQARSGTSVPIVPAQCRISTRPTVHHSKNWTLHPEDYWMCFGPQDPHFLHCPTTPPRGTHTWSSCNTEPKLLHTTS